MSEAKLEYLNLLNSRLLADTACLVVVLSLAVFYFYKRHQSFYVTFLVLVQVIIDLLLLPLAYSNWFVGYSHYMLRAAVALYVIYMLYNRAVRGVIKLKLVEVLLIHCQMLLLIAFFARFIDRAYLDNVDMSSSFSYIQVAVFQFAIFSLMLPVFRMIYDNIAIYGRKSVLRSLNGCGYK